MIKKQGLLLGMALCMMMFAATPVKAMDNTIEKTGKCGIDAQWSLDEKGNMTITGQGKLTKKFYLDKTFNRDKVITITIEDNITEIGKEVFEEFENLKSVTMPESLEYIEDEAFLDCMKLNNIQMKNNIKVIGNDVFEGCMALKKIELPDSVVQMGEGVFNNCIKLNYVKMPKNLDRIEGYTFYNCTGLKEIKWSENLKYIGKYAFSYCFSFENFIIPETVSYVGNYSFNQCENLKSITVGKSVENIKSTFVANCYSLNKIKNNSKVTVKLYSFNGGKTWKNGKKKTTKLYTGKTAISKNTKYKIKYKLKGGKLKGKKVKTYVYGREVKLPVAVKKGYRFLGWDTIEKRKYIDEDDLIDTIEQGETGNKILIARFAKIKK